MRNTPFAANRVWYIYLNAAPKQNISKNKTKQKQTSKKYVGRKRKTKTNKIRGQSCSHPNKTQYFRLSDLVIMIWTKPNGADRKGKKEGEGRRRKGKKERLSVCLFDVCRLQFLFCLIMCSVFLVCLLCSIFRPLSTKYISVLTLSIPFYK